MANPRNPRIYIATRIFFESSVTVRRYPRITNNRYPPAVGKITAEFLPISKESTYYRIHRITRNAQQPYRSTYVYYLQQGQHRHRQITHKKRNKNQYTFSVVVLLNISTIPANDRSGFIKPDADLKTRLISTHAIKGTTVLSTLFLTKMNVRYFSRYPISVAPDIIKRKPEQPNKQPLQ